MFKRLKEICFTLGVFSLLATPIMLPAAVYADSIANQATCGSNLNVDTSCSDQASGAASGDTSINGILSLVINIFSALVGFIAVIMIIFGGVKYITSGGDSGNISGAKNTIVYALIGLVIVALAQVLVHFVLAKVANVSTGNS